MNKLRLSTSNVLGFATVMTFVGMGFENPYLAFTAINLGVSTSIANTVNKKSKHEHQAQLNFQIKSLSNRIGEVTTQVQEHDLLFSQNKETFDKLELQQAKNVEQINSTFEKQQNFQSIQLQYQQNIDEQQQHNSQIHLLSNEIETLKNQAYQQHQLFERDREAIQELKLQQNEISENQAKSNIDPQHLIDLKRLNFRINNRERQIDKHNKKLKQHQQEINIHKSNQNKIISQLQKLNNKQSEVSSIRTKQLTEIEQQIDILIKDINHNIIAPEIKNDSLQTNAFYQATKHQARNLVYIDGNNLYNSLKNIGIEVDYKALFIELVRVTNATQIRIYDGAFPNQVNKYKELETWGYEVSNLPIVQRGLNAYKTIGDDVKLAIDLVREVRNGDRVYLITGDGDFSPAVQEIQQRGVRVTVMAEDSSISPELKQLADDFISLNSFEYRLAKHCAF